MLSEQDLREIASVISGIVKPLNGRLDRIDERLDRIDERLDRMDKRLDRMDERLDQVDERLDQMDKRLDQMDERLDQVDKRLVRVEILVENDVIPRLNTIEECYTSTYERYAKGVDDIESLKTDVSALKKVLIRVNA